MGRLIIVIVIIVIILMMIVIIIVLFSNSVAKGRRLPSFSVFVLLVTKIKHACRGCISHQILSVLCRSVGRSVFGWSVVSVVVSLAELITDYAAATAQVFAAHPRATLVHPPLGVAAA